MTNDEQPISESDGERDVANLLTFKNNDNIDNSKQPLVDCQMAKKVSCGIRSKIMKREVEVKVEMNVERGEKRLVVMDDSGVRRAKEGRNKPP